MSYQITATALDGNNVRVSANTYEVLGDDKDARYPTREAAEQSAQELRDQSDTVRFPGLQFSVEEGR